MTELKHLLLVGAIVIFALAAQILAPVDIQPQPQPASADTSDKYDGDCTGNETAGRCADKPLINDHSYCQYPDRTTNPPGGCDNTDPCDPANVKGGSGDCLVQPTSLETPVTSTPDYTSEMGGK